MIAMPAVLLAAAVGCGSPQMGKVSGRVTFKGRPVPKAIVKFSPQSRPGASGVTDDDGRYRLSTKASFDGAFAGRHAVTVVPWLLGVGDGPTDPRLMAPPEDRKDIPEQYRVSYTSPLSAEVVAGRDNTIDFELTD